ncbi:MAG TPA: c-type cytochrome [Candidatus Saccharimonadales bacterium]|jgi:mono/diheme cytochrome c family protein|nr:c-type cytochrome [Candidatus Saccharimonadales bacterium]
MKPLSILCLAWLLLTAGCSRHSTGATAPVPEAKGTQIVEVSGGKQITSTGSFLPQPVVVQVNGADGNRVAKALVTFRGAGAQFTPQQALTDSSGQVTVNVQLGAEPRGYQILADTLKPDGGTATLALRAVALGYQQRLGREVNDQYCIRCHDPESTPERASNFDNLSPAPHAFTDGSFLNNFSDASLLTITTRGGVAQAKSPAMPPFGGTLTEKQVKAVVAYIRAVADPPYQSPGVKYGE